MTEVGRCRSGVILGWVITQQQDGDTGLFVFFFTVCGRSRVGLPRAIGVSQLIYIYCIAAYLQAAVCKTMCGFNVLLQLT